MQRVHQLVFVISLLALSWFGMLAVHEFGHVVGAFATGGRLQRVVLHPLTISRTDISPNPHPLIVVWLGPVLGCLVPLTIWLLIPQRFRFARHVAQLFTGFCLIANGAYISLGSLDGVGDCGVMLEHGSPLWTLFAFGAVTIPSGFCLWHRLGSATTFLAEPSRVRPAVAYAFFVTVVVLFALACTISPT